MMASKETSCLLPDFLRCKTSKILVFQPQAILLDFHGTISERRWEDKVIFPYVRRALAAYLKDNWSDDAVQRCLPGLKNESFEQRFRNKYEDAPVIDEITMEADDADVIQLVDQMSDFLLWQITNKRETRETQTISRLVWLDGIRRKQIATPIFDDVLPAVRSWRESFGCNVGVISSVDEVTLRLLLENTNKGNLGQYITSYVNKKRMAERAPGNSYGLFYDRLVAKSLKTRGSAKANSQSARGGSLENDPVDIQARPVLFVTDSGQEAKAAVQVADGLAFECVLINRPGNKRIRTYYLSQFQCIDQFTDIDFVSYRWQ